MSADGGEFLGVMPPVKAHICAGPSASGLADWTVWRCGVDGAAWRLEPDTTDYGHDWQPGDVRHPVWRRFPEMDLKAGLNALPPTPQVGPPVAPPTRPFEMPATRIGDRLKEPRRGRARDVVPPPAPASPATVQPVRPARWP